LAELTKRHEFGRFDVKMGKVIGGEVQHAAQASAGTCLRCVLAPN